MERISESGEYNGLRKVFVFADSDKEYENCKAYKCPNDKVNDVDSLYLIGACKSEKVAEGGGGIDHRKPVVFKVFSHIGMENGLGYVTGKCNRHGRITYKGCEENECGNDASCRRECDKRC